jgi:hypothetical protein
MPQPRTEGGIIFALAHLDTAMKVPVDTYFSNLGKVAETNLYKSNKCNHHHYK